MTVREFDLLQYIYEANAQLGEEVCIPPGDDLGMVKFGDAVLLAGVDQVVAGRHFDAQRTPIELVGRKSVTRSLSDVAAMAARPVAMLATAILPADLAEDQTRSLFDAMRETAAEYGSPLIGGDIAIHNDCSHPLTCTTTVLAAQLDASLPPRTRDSAQVGDAVYVTGVLGGAMGADGLGHHLTFQPRIPEVIDLYLHLRDRLHAVIDLSDGLGRDVGHIARMSNVEIEIDAKEIPARGGLDWRHAVSDGEDYEVCFTAAGEVPQEINGLQVTRIGRVLRSDTNQDRRAWLVDGSMRMDISECGWQHEASG